jgi:hypothetical protein
LIYYHIISFAKKNDMIEYQISFSYHFVSNSLLFYTHLPVQTIQNG